MKRWVAGVDGARYRFAAVAPLGVLAALAVTLTACGDAPAPGLDSRGAGVGDQAEAASHPGGASAPGAISLRDDRGIQVELPGRPDRIVSLVPAATEALVLMHADGQLVGRTDYDTLAAVQPLPSVGGGLGPNLEILRTLEPDLVITFAGESDIRTSAALEQLRIPEFAVRPDQLDDVLRILHALGELTGHVAAADSLVSAIQTDVDLVRSAVADASPLDVIYLLGGSPPLAAGPGTFISDLMAMAGAANALTDLRALYAPVSPEVLRARDVDLIVVSEGTQLDDRIVSGRQVVTVPAWLEIPGPHMGRAARVMAAALRPELAEQLSGSATATARGG